jgi:hypothetical protein
LANAGPAAGSRSPLVREAVDSRKILDLGCQIDELVAATHANASRISDHRIRRLCRLALDREQIGSNAASAATTSAGANQRQLF